MLAITALIYTVSKLIFGAHKSRYKWKKQAVLVRAADNGTSRDDVRPRTTQCCLQQCCFDLEELFGTGSQASGKSGKSQKFSTMHSGAFDSRKMNRDSYQSWLHFRGGKGHPQPTTDETWQMTNIADLVEIASSSSAWEEAKALCSGEEPGQHCLHAQYPHLC